MINKPKAIICDIDGTLALMSGRSPYEWVKVGDDTVNRPVLHLLKNYSGSQVIFVSGRDSVCRASTVDWLFYKAGIANPILFMRAEGDMRKDSIVKRELFDEHIRDSYDVQFVLDDRDQVVEMWRSLGLACFQVAEGDF